MGELWPSSRGVLTSREMTNEFPLGKLFDSSPEAITIWSKLLATEKEPLAERALPDFTQYSERLEGKAPVAPKVETWRAIAVNTVTVHLQWLDSQVDDDMSCVGV